MTSGRYRAGRHAATRRTGSGSRPCASPAKVAAVSRSKSTTRLAPAENVTRPKITNSRPGRLIAGSNERGLQRPERPVVAADVVAQVEDDPGDIVRFARASLVDDRSATPPSARCTGRTASASRRDTTTKDLALVLQPERVRRRRRWGNPEFHAPCPRPTGSIVTSRRAPPRSDHGEPRRACGVDHAKPGQEFAGPQVDGAVRRPVRRIVAGRRGSTRARTSAMGRSLIA